MKTALDYAIEENNMRFDKYEEFLKGNNFCKLIDDLGYTCSECPCNIHDSINGDGDMECALDRVMKMLELLDNDLNENKAYNLSQKLGARNYPDCYNTH